MRFSRIPLLAAPLSLAFLVQACAGGADDAGDSGLNQPSGGASGKAGTGGKAGASGKGGAAGKGGTGG